MSDLVAIEFEIQISVEVYSMLQLMKTGKSGGLGFASRERFPDQGRCRLRPKDAVQ